MKKLLVILMSCVLALGLMGGAFAYFTDTEESTGNTFTAGYVDLEINDSSTPGVVFTLVDMAPGVASIEYEIEFENAGSIEGTLTFDVVLTGQPAEPNTLAPDGTGVNVSGNDYAAQVEVITLEYDGGDILALITSQAGNLVAPLTLKELADYSGPFSDPSETLTPTESVTITYAFELDEDADDDYQGDGVVVSMSATLTSVGD